MMALVSKTKKAAGAALLALAMSTMMMATAPHGAAAWNLTIFDKHDPNCTGDTGKVPIYLAGDQNTSCLPWN